LFIGISSGLNDLRRDRFEIAGIWRRWEDRIGRDGSA
jgi:hypothetical protein